MKKTNIVRYEPFYKEWITMDNSGHILAVEFEPNFKEEDYPDIKFVNNSHLPIFPHTCSVPIIVQVLTTQRCSYRCPHCPVVSNEFEKEELSKEELFKLFEYCADLGVLCIRFSGGESTLRKDFCELVEYANSLGLKTALLSNCNQCSPELLNMYSQLCYVQTHLDSVDETTFNNLTGGNHFATFCKNIKLIKSRGVTINAAATIQSKNLYEFQNIIDFCAENKLVLKINTIYSDADGKFKEQEWHNYYFNVLSPFIKMWPQLKAYAKEKGCIVHAFCEQQTVDESVDDPISVISPWGRTYIVIDSKGDVYPFPLIIKDELKLGNIREGKTLMEIWQSSAFLENLRSYDMNKIGCPNCRMDCVYCNLFFSYSYMGKFGQVLPNNECIYGLHKIYKQ